MHNPNNYIQYTDFGYDEDADRRKNRRIATITICLVTFFLILTFSIAGIFNNSCNDLVNMEKDVNLAFRDVKSAMQNRLKKVSDLTKVDEDVAENISTIIGDVSDARATLESCTTPEELDATNAEITNKINKVSTLLESYMTTTKGLRYKNLMDQIEEAENKVNIAKEEYNAAISEYNKLLGDFPYFLIAKMYGFEARKPFEVD